MTTQQPEAQERKFWKRLCALNRFSFFYMGGGVARASDKSGNWIEVHSAQEIVDDAECEVSALSARITELESQLSAIGAGGVSPLMNAAQEATHLRELAAYRLTVENMEREIAAQQPAQSSAAADTVVLEAALRAIHQAIDLIGAPDTERLRTVRRVLRGAVVVAEDCKAPQADSVLEDAARWNAWASGIVEACNSDEQEPAFLVALDKAIGDAEPPVTLELLNAWTDAARKQGASQ